MAGYIVNKIDFSTSPAALQHVTIDYKLASANTFILVNNNVSVNTNGTLPAPQTIGSLVSGQTYNIRATNNVGSPASQYIKTVIIP